ncbi:MAG: hypothetical protein HYW01_09260 [Deltaproteobacteria bacterium]|nr:hypothetical protein [Deltaproteobacteria bacterium]
MSEKAEGKEVEKEKLEKKPFTEAKLTFIEPKLTKYEEVTKITGQGFFGEFSPPRG